MVFNFKKKSNSLSADVINEHLILSLPHALEPIVWRMAMDKIGTAAFEVKQDAKSETTNLILKPKKGTAEIIAPFATKEDAIDALMAASNAMQNAERTSTANDSPNTRKPNRIKEKTKITHAPSVKNASESQKWIIAILGAIIVIGLYSYLTTLIPNTVDSTTISNQASMATGAPQDTTGVPVSADDFFSGM